MPRLSRWLIRTALLYLVVGLGLGVVRTLRSGGLLPGDAATLWLPQLHALTVGWLTQLIFGVAYWLFPGGEPAGDGKLTVWTGYGLLNTGLLMRLVAEPSLPGGGMRPTGLVLSAALQWVAVLLLGAYFWRRVRPK